MTTVSPIATGQLIALFGLLIWAVMSDLRTRRVPNVLVLTGIAVALAGNFGSSALAGQSLAGNHWWSPLAGLAAGFALLLPLHLLRAMGAGDVKLLAMVGAFIGPATVFSAFVYALVAGGLLSLAFMLGKGVAAQTINNLRFLLTDWGQRASTGQGLRLAPLASTAARLPYAVAISVGTVAGLAWPLLGH